jgi:AraC-like DNA-binding protein/ligand-binding sensor protein
LRPVASWNLVHHGKRRENPFCAMFAASSPACGACLEAQKRMCDPGAHAPQTVVCFGGLSEASVPVRAGERLVGFLQTGGFIVGKPTGRQFAKTKQLLAEWGAQVNLPKLEEAYFQTRSLTSKHYASIVRLLAIFSEHLGLVANRMAIQSHHEEPSSVVKARQYIREHHGEAISLTEVARAVNMSTFYFCKTFKSATGFTFTDYVSRFRIERARELLLNPQARIGEVAYEAGFQSLTHFNRSFHRVLGESPSAYRESLQSSGLPAQRKANR